MVGVSESKPWKFWQIFLFAILIPILVSFYKFFYTKNYDFLVEAKCDPSAEICFTRDCENSDDCPPNQLSIYKEFYVKAYDFSRCSDNSCAQECAKAVINCTPVICGESLDDVCTVSPL